MQYELIYESCLGHKTEANKMNSRAVFFCEFIYGGQLLLSALLMPYFFHDANRLNVRVEIKCWAPVGRFLVNFH